MVVERLLSISGEDTLTVNRKYREQWTGKLPTRICCARTSYPELGDASTAIAGRFVPVLLTALVARPRRPHLERRSGTNCLGS